MTTRPTWRPPKNEDADQADAPEPGGTIGDGYLLGRLLGAGGMGAVYEAQTVEGERVAIKVLLEQFHDLDEARVRFDREGRLAMGLDDPHVVRTLDVGVDARTGTPFIVMPLLVGFDVRSLMDDLGYIHPTLAARIVRQACLGLAAAHAAEVIHRDIKPANLFLDHASDGTVTVRLMDLGIAKWRDVAGDLTRTGSHMGTPRYMAPEQVSDAKKVVPATDVWSMGVTLYEMLTGEQPFGEWSELADVWLAIASLDPQMVQEHAPWIDPGLAEIVHGTMLRDHEQRCPSAGALHRALEPFTDGSDLIHASMFTSVSRTLIDHVAPSAERPTSWQDAKPVEAAPTIQRSDEDPLLGRTIDGKYALLRCLGEGGMGAVYEAEIDDGSRVALKIIRPELAGTSRTARRRFVREAKVVQKLDSDHIVKVTEVGADPQHELPFIAMELLAGHDLEHAMRRHGALPPKVVARLFLQAARGIEAAHALGFIHRDVKPANLFLALQPDASICVKVCDFGVAKQLEPEPGGATTANLTRSGSVIGSPMYMSPEQAKNEETIDERSDVWSLGATMYEALSGIAPWAGHNSIPQIIIALCSDELKPVQERAPWVPAAIAEVVHRAMQKDPNDRFASVSDMCAALEEITGDHRHVHVEDVRPVTKEGRAERAARANTAPPVTHAGTTHTVDEAPSPPRRGYLAVAAAAVVLAGAAYVGLDEESAPRPASPPAITASAPAPTVSVSVAIPEPVASEEPEPPPPASSTPRSRSSAPTPSAQPRPAPAAPPAPVPEKPTPSPKEQPAPVPDKPKPDDLEAREKW